MSDEMSAEMLVAYGYKKDIEEWIAQGWIYVPSLGGPRPPNQIAHGKAYYMRKFDTGAIRNDDSEKLDYEGFLSPFVLERYAEYMHKHRKMKDGSLRDSDNWQKGIPIDQYMKSLLRHFMTVWKAHRALGYLPEEELCAMFFNVQGLLHEELKRA